MTRQIITALIVLGTVATRGHAQGVASQHDNGVGTCVIDSAAARRSAVLTLWLVPSTELTDTSANAVMERALITEMQETFRAPAAVNLWPWPGTGMPEGFGLQSLGGELRVTIRDGEVTEHIWVVTPRYSPLASAAQGAFERAVASEGFHSALRAAPKRNGELSLRVLPSTVASPKGVSLHQTRVTYLAITEPAKRLDGPAPKYPPSLIDNVGGHVDFEYVIGELGRVVAASIWVVEFTNSGFVAAARTAIEEANYQPATVNGCPVGQMVHQRVSFLSR